MTGPDVVSAPCLAVCDITNGRRRHLTLDPPDEQQRTLCGLPVSGPATRHDFHRSPCGLCVRNALGKGHRSARESAQVYVGLTRHA